MKKLYFLFFIIVMMASCSVSPDNVQEKNEQAPMYPDYTDITIPVNIAPLNFIMRNDPQRVCVYVNDKEFYNEAGARVEFDMDRWKNLLEENVGKKLNVRIDALYDNGWEEYKAFTWDVSGDKVDPYLTYRLIEPDYEVFNNLVLQERCVENFETKNFSNYTIVGNKCMNCHTYADQDPGTSMFYVRGEGGGAILNMNGELQKLNLKREDWISSSVYFGFSPSKQHIVFSTNKIIPAFHSSGSNRLEVFDTESDIYVANLAKHKIIESPLLCDSTKLETFPTFSPDGKYIYYCSSEGFANDTVSLSQRLHKLQYSLCRIGFDESTSQFGTEVDTIYNARTEGKSVCHPRISPDGRFLVFTLADYGTFPIWHREADLAMMDLTNGKLLNCKIVNSDMSDTYHSWSSNSRWLVFASKRDDGLYGKPYYTHISKDGTCTKPFALPQEYATFYDNCLKSFNAPEQGKGPLPFTTHDVKKAMGKQAIEFR